LFLALSNKEPNEICEYPDSNKKWDRQQKKFFQNGVELENYWKDEEETMTVSLRIFFFN
jgi:uncharacterized cupin superfamily protein